MEGSGVEYQRWAAGGSGCSPELEREERMRSGGPVSASTTCNEPPNASPPCLTANGERKGHEVTLFPSLCGVLESHWLLPVIS